MIRRRCVRTCRVRDGRPGGGFRPLIASAIVPPNQTPASPRSPLALLRVPALRRVRRSDWLQLVRFLSVGLTGYVVNLVVFWLLTAGGLHYLPAAVVAFAVAWVNNFLLNRHWTFRAGAEALMGQGGRYLLVCLVALGANLIILHVLVDSGLGAVYAQAIAIILVTPVNYLLSRRWSFR